jgi:hypothetical protein
LPFHGALAMYAQCVHDIHGSLLAAAVAHVGNRHKECLEHPENEENGVPQGTEENGHKVVDHHGKVLLTCIGRIDFSYFPKRFGYLQCASVCVAPVRVNPATACCF